MLAAVSIALVPTLADVLARDRDAITKLSTCNLTVLLPCIAPALTVEEDGPLCPVGQGGRKEPVVLVRCEEIDLALVCHLERDLEQHAALEFRDAGSERRRERLRAQQEDG